MAIKAASNGVTSLNSAAGTIGAHGGNGVAWHSGSISRRNVAASAASWHHHAGESVAATGALSRNIAVSQQ